MIFCTLLLDRRAHIHRFASCCPLQEDRPFLLSVEDPNDPSNDLGRNSFNISKVRSAFDFAYCQLIAPSKPGDSLLQRIIRLDPAVFHRKPTPHAIKTAEQTANNSKKPKQQQQQQQPKDAHKATHKPSKKNKKARKHRERSLSDEKVDVGEKKNARKARTDSKGNSPSAMLERGQQQRSGLLLTTKGDRIESHHGSKYYVRYRAIYYNSNTDFI